ncbi:EAL domain-containing response regulator [Methyloradius palustris]|uniref:Two-component system response regulator n=1 Tax=Methyloradius palustris TaxID=2778876 RepID=A0A8D5JWK9_9PROT|nr:EAL domain-containing protein [Methyloradius palustris]BCM25199.1 two-component system response regulator [Methyloradius palustris]
MTSPNATILIVDDEPQNCKLLSAMLKPEGYLTICANSGLQALSLIASNPPDLILLDIMMPEMDGYQMTAILKADPSTANIPIIMVTALSDQSACLAGLKAGAEEFLSKPIDRTEMWLRIRNLLRLKAFDDFLQNHNALLEQQIQERTADLKRFRLAMDATTDAITLVDRATMHYVEVNATACNMLGYTREELLKIGPSHIGAGAPKELAREYDGVINGHSKFELKETQLRRKDGSEIQVEIYRHAQRSGNEWIIVGVIRDITERKEAERRMHHLAHYDPLTGLPNRTLFYEMLRKTLTQAIESKWLVAVLFVDMDHFKNVNDTLGHMVGDELLIEFSNRLVQCVRIRDTVGRMGGDEFALILTMEDDELGATVVANKIRDALREPFYLSGNEVTVTASIGITLHPNDASDAQTLLKYADTAMYRAKHAGRDTYRFFTAQMNVDVLARLEMEKALRKAIENEEFELYYQPKVYLKTGRITGVEALIRWNRPGHGMVSPQFFIPVLEDTGLIVRVGSWVIATACKQIALWRQSSVGALQISVNVSGQQFVEGDLDGDVISALTENDIPPHLLELELTESSMMVNTERTIAILDKLKKLGVQISIDDFGTGYSSLAYLRRFPIDKLKIDIAFIRDITHNADDAALALTIIRMAHGLKMEVIAEGVETIGQLAYLRHYRCDHIQGYYFSPPVTVTELEKMLLSAKRMAAPALPWNMYTVQSALSV